MYPAYRGHHAINKGEHMANPEDASIKLLYAVDDGTFFTADTVESGTPFDLVANIEIGENLNENVDDLDLFVGVRNLTQSTPVTTVTHHEDLIPANNQEVRREVRVNVDPPWSANEGDVLQAVATLKITHGANADYSHAESDFIVVVA
jgi:hypothetical protein